MDFDEPDLEELIQNDLRSEMNKILSQSEVEELEAAAKHQSSFEPGTSSRNPSYGYRAEMVIKREVDESEMLHGAFDVMEATSLQELDQHEQTPQRHQEISGHFSVGSYTNFLNELGHLPPGITEHGDLQSLTWLTTVDVQALQKLTEQGTIGTTAIQAAQQEAIQAHAQAQGITPEQQSVIQMVQMANLQEVSQANGTSGNHQPDPNITSSCTSPRYMPIEPNLSPESRRFLAQQRYHLHGHPGGGPIGRHSFNASQSGPRRYIPGHVMGHHPYPPPPYTTGGGPYMHGVPLMHHRYQHPVQQQKVYPKPVYSYSCLIAMALCNSKTGCLPVSEIYHFMTENYPYFKTAPDGWKNSVRHNLSLNKCFEKVEKPNTSQRKGCLWALNPAKIAKMKEEVQKWKRKDPDSIRRSMSNPEELDRELEEIRRADEEAARRRMLSLSSHGLTAQSFHGHHQHHPARFLPIHPPVVSHMNTPVLGPPSHPSTSRRRADLHFSTELAQQNFALTLARSAFQPAPTRANPYDLTLHGSSLSQGSIASTSFNVGSNNNNNSNPDMGTGTDMIVLTPSGGKLAFFASPHSASSTSSNNTSLLGTFADCTAGLCVEEDFDASLADIAGLHDPFWDAPHDPEPGISREIGETCSESEGTRSVLPSEVQEYSPSVSSDGQIRLPPVIQMLSSTQSEQPSPDTPDFKTTTSQRMDNFGRDMSHFANNSIKPVVML